MKQTEKNYRLGRVMYTMQAAFEFLINTMVTGSFLAMLTKELGMTDSMTGILSAAGSLGCLVQLLSVLIRKTQVKPLVITMSILTELLFLLLYVIPLTGMPADLKQGFFIAAVLLAYLSFYLVHPKKINWLMSLVDDHRRGSFTANKENISLLAGMGFSFLLSAIMDRYSAIGNMVTAFTICGFIMPVLILLHTGTLVFTVEKPLPAEAKKSLSRSIRDVARNKNVIRVTILFELYYIANCCATPFFTTYQLSELGFSLTLVTILGIVSSVSRILFSRFWGKYADRKSFAAMMEKCLMILAAAYLCVSFTVPKNGILMFAVHYALSGIAMGGIGSALTNLVFDYAEPDKRADSFAVSQAFSGVAGFLTTLVVSPVVSAIQRNGNKVFGLPIYAQQLMAGFSFCVLVISIIYIRTVIMKQQKQTS